MKKTQYLKFKQTEKEITKLLNKYYRKYTAYKKVLTPEEEMFFFNEIKCLNLHFSHREFSRLYWWKAITERYRFYCLEIEKISNNMWSKENMSIEETEQCLIVDRKQELFTLLFQYSALVYRFVKEKSENN